MSYHSLLVDVAADPRRELRLRLAAGLARTFEAELVGVFTAPLMFLPAPYGNPAAMLGAEVLEAQRSAIAEEVKRAREAFEAACAEAQVSGEWYDEEGEAGEVIATYARYSDLTVVGQSEAGRVAGLAQQLPERVVLGSGRPVLIVPHSGSFERVGDHVVVAWNGAREAARAVADALPFLSRAAKVTVLEIDPADGSGETGKVLARRLARHGVPASARHTVSAGTPPAEILLSALADEGADLLVMGAYGHSRMREMALGGVTRAVLGHMTVPVVMSY
jgi:nucleotide-binding universal stress UspA family protein